MSRRNRHASGWGVWYGDGYIFVTTAVSESDAYESLSRKPWFDPKLHHLSPMQYDSSKDIKWASDATCEKLRETMARNAAPGLSIDAY